MKKLTILTAVAALAAFGWASGATAFDCDAPATPSCTYVDADDGILDDTFTVSYSGVPGCVENAVAVSIVCTDPAKPRSKSGSTRLDAGGGAGDVFTVDELNFNGPRGMKTNDVCVAFFKGLHEPGINNGENVISMDACGAIDAD